MRKRGRYIDIRMNSKERQKKRKVKYGNRDIKMERKRMNKRKYKRVKPEKCRNGRELIKGQKKE